MQITFLLPPVSRINLARNRLLDHLRHARDARQKSASGPGQMSTSRATRFAAGAYKMDDGERLGNFFWDFENQSVFYE